MHLVFYQRKYVTHRCTLERAMCVTLLPQCTVRYSAPMSRPKPPQIVRYTIRLNRAQGERVAALKAQLHARSDNEVFDYLVTVGTNQRDDLEQLVYSLFGNLADSLARRFQSLGDGQSASSRLDRHVHQVRPHGSPRGSNFAHRGSQGACGQNLRTGEYHCRPRVPAPERIGRLFPGGTWN